MQNLLQPLNFIDIIFSVILPTGQAPQAKTIILFERIFIMNKTQLVDVVAKNTGLKKKDAEAAVTALVEAVEEALVAGDKVQVAGLGTFDVKVKAARTGRNPKTQATIEIPASKRPAFSASKSLKEAVNK